MIASKKTDRFLNVSEAADVIGCTVSRVRQLLRSGEMAGNKVNERAWLVTEAEAKRVAARPHTTGKPRGTKKQ